MGALGDWGGTYFSVCVSSSLHSLRRQTFPEVLGIAIVEYYLAHTTVAQLMLI